MLEIILTIVAVVAIVLIVRFLVFKCSNKNKLDYDFEGGLPNPKNYPDVLHYNGDTTDNSIENLYWGKRVRKGCQLNGEKHGRRLLNIGQIKEIRHQRSLGWSFAELALKYNVSIGCIQGVLTKTWKSVK